jgi:tetratricopeptide (TPR) repeat protein
MTQAGTIVVLMLLAGAGAAPVLDEFDAYLAVQRERLAEPGLSLAQREEIVLDMAATLHRAAEHAGTDEARLRRWAESSELIDTFEAEHPGHPRHALFIAQAGADRAAAGRVLAAQAEIRPDRPELRDRAAVSLDEAIRRLGSIDLEAAPDLAPRVRLQHAAALMARADLEPSDAEAARERRTRALALLEDSPPRPDLAGTYQLLKSRIQIELGLLDDAERSLEAADAASAPLAERTSALVSLRLARKRFVEASAAIDRLPETDHDERALLNLRVALARREEGGTEGEKGETDALQIVRGLRESGDAAARLALVRLGRAVDEPSTRLDADGARLLVEAKLAAGEGAAAAALAARAAEQADADGHPDDAASLRYQAAAIFVRERRVRDAIGLLDAVADSEPAGPLRARAALLRAVLLGRGGAGTTPYLEALSSLIERFPEAAEAGEARWLLGRARREQDDLDAAESLWLAIPRGHPRWLDARLAVARAERERIEGLVQDDGAEEARQRIRAAREALGLVEAEVPGEDPSRNDLALAAADLDLVPIAGEPRRALGALDRLLSAPLDEARRERGRLLRVLALAGTGQYAEAERAYQDAVERALTPELIELTRRLDLAASLADSDLAARRLGALLRVVGRTILDGGGDLDGPARAEVGLRMIRADYFRGDVGGARRAFAGWADAVESLPPATWPDLADLAMRLGDARRAIDVELRVVRRGPPGSLASLRAQFQQALALSQLGHDDEALKVLDATATLHPDLGGPALKARYEALRKRLESR